MKPTPGVPIFDQQREHGVQQQPPATDWLQCGGVAGHPHAAIWTPALSRVPRPGAARKSIPKIGCERGNAENHGYSNGGRLMSCYAANRGEILLPLLTVAT